MLLKIPCAGKSWTITELKEIEAILIPVCFVLMFSAIVDFPFIYPQIFQANLGGNIEFDNCAIMWIIIKNIKS